MLNDFTNFNGNFYYHWFEPDFAMVFTSMTMLDDRTVIIVGASDLLLNGNAVILVNKDLPLAKTLAAPY